MSIRPLRPALTALGFALALAACDSGGPDGPDLTELEAAFGCDVTVVSLGSTTSGSLATSDCQLVDDSFIDYFALEIDEATEVTVVLSSSDLDAYLFLYNRLGGVVVADDDAGGGSDAQIERTLQPGVYGLGANSFGSGEVGAYTLRVTAD